MQLLLFSLNQLDIPQSLLAKSVVLHEHRRLKVHHQEGKYLHHYKQLWQVIFWLVDLQIVLLHDLLLLSYHQP